MAKIFTDAARVGASRVIEPIARALLRAGVSPDAVTVLGTVGVVAAAIGFGARGEFLVAALVVAVFALVDTLDGTMARLRGYSTRFGALLDSVMDRIGDGAVFGALVFWYATSGEPVTVVAGLLCLVAAQVISYVKARAQSVGLPCDVGIVERAERLLLVGVGALATGLGVGWALPAALWLLAVLSIATVVQRIIYVRRADRRLAEENAG
jgi:CDP-diacylglycerol---glycerol-3-phosphate 3-phosphatidyltransferase